MPVIAISEQVKGMSSEESGAISFDMPEFHWIAGDYKPKAGKRQSRKTFFIATSKDPNS